MSTEQSGRKYEGGRYGCIVVLKPSEARVDVVKRPRNIDDRDVVIADAMVRNENTLTVRAT